MLVGSFTYKMPPNGGIIIDVDYYNISSFWQPLNAVIFTTANYSNK